jgi:hypothetical protein
LQKALKRPEGSLKAVEKRPPLYRRAASMPATAQVMAKKRVHRTRKIVLAAKKQKSTQGAFLSALSAE